MQKCKNRLFLLKRNQRLSNRHKHKTTNFPKKLAARSVCKCAHGETARLLCLPRNKTVLFGFLFLTGNRSNWSCKSPGLRSGRFLSHVRILPSHRDVSPQWRTFVPTAYTAFGTSSRSQCRSRRALNPIHFHRSLTLRSLQHTITRCDLYHIQFSIPHYTFTKANCQDSSWELPFTFCVDGKNSVNFTKAYSEYSISERIPDAKGYPLFFIKSQFDFVFPVKSSEYLLNTVYKCPKAPRNGCFPFSWTQWTICAS